ETRLIGESDREFDTFDVAIGKFAAGAFGGFSHSDLGQQIKRSIAMQFRSGPPEVISLTRVRNQRHLHILNNGHRTECCSALKGPADAKPPPLPRREPGDVAACEQNLP